MSNRDDQCHDLFISYSSADNELAPPYHEWVSRFVRALKSSLKALGCQPRVYFDEESARPYHDWSKIEEACQKAKLFLAISSPAFDAGDWPQRELNAFLGNSDAGDRLFVIKRWPTGKAENPLLRGRTHLKFYLGREDEPALLKPGTDEFAGRAMKLAGAIKERLDEMDGGAASDPAASAPRPQLGPVLLAMTTEDLDPQRDRLATAFTQLGISVLPEQEYPLGAMAFKEAFAADLERCKLVVQLLGRLPGRHPPDLPEGFLRHQADAAAAAGVDIMQWRALDVDPAAVPDAPHRALLQRETVIASTMEQFKNEIRAKLETPPPRPARADGANPGFMVFVNAEKADEAAALVMKAALEGEYSVVLPDYSATGSIQDDYRENLEACHALLLVYGQTVPGWIRGQMRFMVKTLQGTPPQGGILYGPPPEKPHINFGMPGFRELDCRTEDGAGWRIEPVRDLMRDFAKSR